MNFKIGDHITIHLRSCNPTTVYEIVNIVDNNKILLLNKNVVYNDKRTNEISNNPDFPSNDIHYSYCDLSIKYIRKLKLQKLKNES